MKFFVFALVAFLPLRAGDFIFSAHFSSTNHVITFQDFLLSPSMQEKSQDDGSYLCTINKKKPKNQNEYKYLLKHKEELYECFLAQKVKVYGNSSTELLRSKTQTQYFVTPVRFRAEFDEHQCKIYLLK